MWRDLNVGDASSNSVRAPGSNAGSATEQPRNSGWVAATWVIQKDPKLVPVQTSRVSSTSGRARSQSTRAWPASTHAVGVTWTPWIAASLWPGPWTARTANPRASHGSPARDEDLPWGVHPAAGENRGQRSAHPRRPVEPGGQRTAGERHVDPLDVVVAVLRPGEVGRVLPRVEVAEQLVVVPDRPARERCMHRGRGIPLGVACLTERMTLTLGYKASAEQFTPRDLVEYSVLAEEVGLDSVVVSDHFQPWRHTGGHAPFSLAWMAAVGERTSRVQLGTSVLTATFRYNPAVIAQAFATMACLYPDRVMLGLGTGEALNETAVTGVEWPDFKGRFARMREAVRLMRQLWTEDEVTFDGEFYRTVNATVYDRPENPVPVYVAAGGPVVARYAGRSGEGFICTSGKGMDLYTEKLLPAVAEGAEAAGRDLASIDKMIEIKLSYDRDPDQARENCRFWAPLSLTPDQKHSVDSSTEMERLADELPIEQVTSRWIVASTPEQVLEQVQPYVDAGLNHLVFHGPGHDQRRFLTQLSEDVLPVLRTL